ncbi:YesL family protein [Paenarthrobacter sp. CAP02]|uniref:YesL family protein n=1 Tax=Paenarthrobacter sp. CAP02 TaxID=3158144 RepID=UPI0032DA197F
MWPTRAAPTQPAHAAFRCHSKEPMPPEPWACSATMEKGGAMASGGFSFKAYSLFDTLVWIACLNVLWIIFTVLGGVVFGFGPSTAAAQLLVRDKVRGVPHHWCGASPGSTPGISVRVMPWGCPWWQSGWP